MTDNKEQQPMHVMSLMVFRTADDKELQINLNYDHNASNDDHLAAIHLISKTLQAMVGVGGVDGEQTH